MANIENQQQEQIYTEKSTLKNWFRSKLKPTQGQFWAWMDSYWHKGEKLPITTIDGLGEAVDGKAPIVHYHDQYATNDATSLSNENVEQWKKKLNVDNLQFDDQTISLTNEYVDFGLTNVSKQAQFNQAIYESNASKLKEPTYEGDSEEYPYLVGIDEEGYSAKISVNTIGKVKTVNNQEPDSSGNIDISDLSMDWTNPVHKFSKIEDKKLDATYNYVVTMDSTGTIGRASILGSNIKDSGLALGSNAKTLQEWSIAVGVNASSGSAGSLALGFNSSTVAGLHSVAIGSYSKVASGQSLAIGYSTVTNGEYSIALGYYATTESCYSIVLGTNTYTRPNQNKTQWVATDDLFIIGNAKVNSGEKGNSLELFKNGLMKLPDVTTALIETENKAVTTKEFVDNKISNFSLPTNWSNPSVRYSGLVDKSADATFNSLMGLDNNGNVGKLTALGNVLESGLQNLPAEQALRIGQLLNGGQGSVQAISVASIMPRLFPLENNNTTIILNGAGLSLNIIDFRLDILKEDGTILTQVPNAQITFINDNQLKFYYNFNALGIGKFKLKITSGVKVHITTTLFQIVSDVEYIDTSTITWEKLFANDYTASSKTVAVGATVTHENELKTIASASVKCALKSSQIFAQGEDFLIEIDFNISKFTGNAYDNLSTMVQLCYSSTQNVLANYGVSKILWGTISGYANHVLAPLALFLGNIFAENSIDRNKNAPYSNILTIVKQGNEITFSCGSKSYYTTIQNNSGYSLSIQIPYRQTEEVFSLNIMKAYKIIN